MSLVGHERSSISVVVMDIAMSFSDPVSGHPGIVMS
jgi:hypothetical protein